MRRSRFFSAALAHETSTFSPVATSLADFLARSTFDPERGPPSQAQCAWVELSLRQVALARGHEIVDSLYSFAMPSGPPAKTVYATLRDRILSDLRRALPVDGVLLFLHGAQMARGLDSCEADLVTAVRALVGPDIPIAVELDLHANIDQAFADAVDIVAMCLEYPHTDFAERADHILDLAERCIQRRITPVTAFVPVPMLGIFHTTRQPMRGLVDWAKQRQGYDGILSVSIQHGFPYADSPRATAGILVTSDGDGRAARACAEEIAEAMFSLRNDIAVPVLGVDEAIDIATTASGGPVAIADTSDNPGGGAAGDSTFIMQRLLERQIDNVALGVIWDPQACELAEGAGVGAHLVLPIGGKSGPQSGPVLEREVEVLAIRDNVQGLVFGASVDLGPHAAVRLRSTEGNTEIDIVVAKYREQTHGPEPFAALGIDVARKAIVVVKSAQHFYTAFAPIAGNIIYAVAPGSTTTDFSGLNYRGLLRPIWPLDATPFERDGRLWS